MKNVDSKELFDAVFRGSVDEVAKILDSGVDVNALDCDERSPLIHATIDRNIELVKFLLKRGALVNLKDFQDMTPLHFAAQNYDIGMCRCLVDSGADIDPQDDIGNTPLWRAEFESGGSTELQEFLVENGANENLKNFHDVSPRDLREG